jgi:rhodanese-related sulfurtransferase
MMEVIMKTITARELRKMRDANEDFLLVNTLPAEHFPDTKLPGAVNVPEQDDDFVDRVEKRAGSKERTVVVYCANLRCNSSANAAEKLDNAGFHTVFDMEEGAEGWEAVRTEKNGGRKAKEDSPAKR